MIVNVFSSGLVCAAPHEEGLDFILVKAPSYCQHDSHHAGAPAEATQSQTIPLAHHHPRLLVHEKYVGSPSIPADDAVAVPDGSAFLVWRLEGRDVKLDPGGPNRGKVDTKGENPPGRAPRNDDEKTHVRWIPSIVDLAKRGFDERHRKISAVVSSVVHLPGGGKLASESVSKEIYDFSDPILRKVVDSHAMAERISYKLDFSKQDSIVLELAEGQNVTLKERPGEDLPLVVSNLPSASYSIEHFGLYYALLKPYGPMPQLPRGTVNQIQCGGSWITDPRPEHD